MEPNQQQPQYQPPQNQYAPTGEGARPTNAPQIMVNGMPSNASAKVDSPNKKVFIVAGIAVGVLILLTVIALVVIGGSEEAPVEAPVATEEGPTPATGGSLEKLNNSISQDLSSIDDASDFPEEQLSDDTLGL